MLIDIEKWSRGYIEAVTAGFGDRVRFIGLQGSYGRGEATESSDIDMVLLLDRVWAEDIKKYGKLLDTLEHREKICGFFSGERELVNWERADLFQLCYDTEPLVGSLEYYKTLITEEDIRRAVKTGGCNIYHMCIHNLLYDKSPEILKSLFKASYFTMSARIFLETGRYEKRKEALIPLLSLLDREVTTAAEAMSTITVWGIEAVVASETLLDFASGCITM